GDSFSTVWASIGCGNGETPIADDLSLRVRKYTGPTIKDSIDAINRDSYLLRERSARNRLALG
ncbi:MAG: hypothetical protein WA657_12195, partial [Candidatus Acidiferrales bacterium]